MISVVTAYYNRRELFIRTLNSIKRQQCPALLEVIAVDDGSDEKERLEDLTTEFSFLKIIRLEKDMKWYHNSCIPFNIGFKAAKGDKIIIQNPECLHFGNILAYTEHHLKEKEYLSFACFSLDKPSTDHLEELLQHPAELQQIIARDNFEIKAEGQSGWYNHSVYRPVGYHFCAAITRKDLNELRGFDELYSLGIAFDDAELLCRIRRKGILIRFVDEEIALHQNHYAPDATSYHNRSNRAALEWRNSEILRDITSSSTYTANKYLSMLPGFSKRAFYSLYYNYLRRKYKDKWSKTKNIVQMVFDVTEFLKLSSK